MNKKLVNQVYQQLTYSKKYVKTDLIHCESG